jgi:hypothetical protein
MKIFRAMRGYWYDGPYFAEQDKHKQEAIAVRQLNALKEHKGSLDKLLRLS